MDQDAVSQKRTKFVSSKQVPRNQFRRSTWSALITHAEKASSLNQKRTSSDGSDQDTLGTNNKPNSPIKTIQVFTAKSPKE